MALRWAPMAPNIYQVLGIFLIPAVELDGDQLIKVPEERHMI